MLKQKPCLQLVKNYRHDCHQEFLHTVRSCKQEYIQKQNLNSRQNLRTKMYFSCKLSAIKVTDKDLNHIAVQNYKKEAQSESEEYFLKIYH